MRDLLPVALPLAAPAHAQTFTVPQCEKQATEIDATEEVTSFDDFCIKA